MRKQCCSQLQVSCEIVRTTTTVLHWPYICSLATDGRGASRIEPCACIHQRELYDFTRSCPFADYFKWRGAYRHTFSANGLSSKGSSPDGGNRCLCPRYPPPLYALHLERGEGKICSSHRFMICSFPKDAYRAPTQDYIASVICSV
jgi:hypothetical protein